MVSAGATNLMTGFADASMDGAPVVAIAGQGTTTRMRKESHRIMDLKRLHEPVSKHSTEILTPEIVPELVRKAFKDAQAEKPGGVFISFTNPNFVKYAESFGARGYRVNAANELIPTLEQAFADDTVVVIDVPVDYSENMKLTEKLGQLVCPI